MKKRILIVGSISDFGGREVEVNSIIVLLSRQYDVKLFSTVPMTEESMAIEGTNCNWTSIHKELYSSNVLLKCLAWINKKRNKSTLPSYLLVSNKISSVFFNFHEKKLSILKNQIDSVDIVLFCGIFTNGYLREIIDYCSEMNKPLLLRTTGTIMEIPKKIEESLFRISSILVHSHSNANVLKKAGLQRINVVDQTTLVEKSLMKLKINQSKELVYGYIGRFSSEKGIVELLEIFKGLEKKLIIAGNGLLLPQVMDCSINNLFLEYIGEISANKIVDFFEKIDVLIIPSFEESGPLVAIEAMAAGKIILSTRVGAMKDRLDATSNQFWFDINDDKSLIDILSKFESLDMDTVVNIRKELREVYQKRYSKEVISRQYLDVINDCFKVD